MTAERFQALMLAFAVHGVLFVAGGVGLMRGVDYGIDASGGMAEVDLIAAPAPAASALASIPALEKQVPATAPAEDDIAKPVQRTTPPAAPAVTPVPNALLQTKDLSGPLGDGSSPVPGTDTTTIHRAGSSGAYFKPGYYRNPPPPYPEEARKLKQQGRVLLEVHVTPEGKVAGARIKQSSGFPLLDDAAQRGVRNWKFRPATIGGLRVDILADIPIRFQLR